MAKKIALALGILAVIGVIAGGIAFYVMNGRFGLLTAHVVGHDLIAKPDTRLRIAVDTKRLGTELTPYLPEELPVPGWLPWDVPTLLPRVLPHEIAILGGSDYADSAFNLTVFINEQKGGPALPEYLNNQFKFQDRFPQIPWAEAGFHMEERGIVSIDGRLPLPLGLEDTILDLWSLDPPEDTLKLHGGHLAEGVIDNRNGEIITLIGGLAPLWQSSLERIKANSQYAAGIALVEQVYDARVAIDFKDVDTLLIQLRVHAAPDAGGQLEFFMPLILTMVSQQVQKQHGLTLESEYEWDGGEETYTCDIAVIGVEPKLKDYFKRALPSPPKPAA